MTYAPLTAVIDPERAQDPGLPLVDETIAANRAYHGVFAHGDVAAALGAADRVVAVRFHQGRQTHVPMEPRGCLASWQPGDDTLTFWHSTQIPHPMRSALAARLGVPESAVRVITPDVGGGFGQKIPLYREELATAAASRLLGRPVRWIETRRENLLASLHAREDIVDVRAAVKADGAIVGLDVQILTDFGAYAYFPANYMARVIGNAAHLPGGLSARYARARAREARLPGGAAPASRGARSRAHRRDRHRHLRRAEHVRLGVLQDGRHPRIGSPKGGTPGQARRSGLPPDRTRPNIFHAFAHGHDTSGCAEPAQTGSIQPVFPGARIGKAP